MLHRIMGCLSNFYPRSPRGERRTDSCMPPPALRFLSTLPAWGATRRSPPRSGRTTFLSTLPAWGATISAQTDGAENEGISIHAPRVGSDGSDSTNAANSDSISIHAPRVGSDKIIGGKSMRLLNFYPRSPRGERPNHPSLSTFFLTFLSTLPAWGATQRLAESQQQGAISIHAPRVGSDLGFPGSVNPFHQFLSTLPAWGATSWWSCLQMQE